MNDTPMLRQYKEIKSQHEDAILFFRLGDFYEMFLGDAKVASKELELTLTGRGKDESRIPMCGVPYHAADSYIAKLVNHGFKVAICEQVEDASESKGITKREVVKVITPGTVLAHGILDEKENNYLVAINIISSRTGNPDSYGLSFVDITTGEFRVCVTQTKDELITTLKRLGPKEILIPEDLDIELPENILTSTAYLLPHDRAIEEITSHFSIHSINAFGLESEKLAIPSAWALLDYLMQTQKNSIPQITKLLPYHTHDIMQMDGTTIANLELVEPLRKNEKQGSLFWVLDQTKTAMGARALKTLLKAPFYHQKIINQRLDAVESLRNDLLSREEIREMLTKVYDLERLLSRIVSEHNNPKDCMALIQSLTSLNEMHNVLHHLDGHILQSYTSFFESYNQQASAYQKIIQLIENSLIEDPPVSIKDGHFIQSGFNQELDDLKQSFKNIKDWISELEAKEREETGIKGLKVRFNRVFGYYIEISNSFRGEIPEHYIRKQTLANAERYITPELKEKESILLNGEEKQKELEIQLYKDMIQQIKAYVPQLQDLAQVIAQIDVLQSLATVSQKNNYVRPEFSEDDDLILDIKDGRHPVLEKNSTVHYIANDIQMTAKNNSFLLITGPNMAGKSTLMRQAALIVVMAQIGCFVPAREANLSLVDKLFTRIGALDNLYSGQSTFMVEMLETATILHNATQQSLIILDEIGRGTSTYDGMSIAGAVTEHIHNTIGARTLFATHYHELTILDKKLSGLNNYCMGITETADTIVFNYKFIEGPANRSYGIHVAEMAGLPESVIQTANKLLEGFERDGVQHLKEKHANQLALF